jgi:hypothetical protein
MIKFIQCVHRAPGLTVEDFRRQWRDYQEAVQVFAEAAGAKRIEVAFGLAIPENKAIQMLRGTEEPFDAVLEIWWQSGAQAMETSEQAGMKQAIEVIREMQPAFIDLQRSSFFFASDEVDLSFG